MAASWCRIRAIHQKCGLNLLKRKIGKSNDVNWQENSVPLLIQRRCLNDIAFFKYRHRLTRDKKWSYGSRFWRCHTKKYCSSSTETSINVKKGKQKNKPKYESVTYSGRTEPGEKKDLSIPLPNAYSPQFVEAAWYDWWVKQGFFSPTYKSDTELEDAREKFVICLPPPNITGTLHLGHALTNSIQDALVRWNRMKGRETLWIPGIDHAGIATQVMVEKKLLREQGVTRHDVGRDKFIEEVWKWKTEKGDTICNQMKKLGSSLDWDRTCFTMDKNLSEAVTEAFIRLHDDGLIYRGKRLVNWCCHLKSTISDIEVENVPLTGRTKLNLPGYDREVEFGTILTFSYKVKETGEVIHVSTTRPETMLGDTAVCVHPSDARYTHLHGNHVVHPFDDRLIPIICDDFVDQTFGTGAVKITPAHDYRDSEVGRRHNLPVMIVIGEDGTMVNVPDSFLGMKRFDAREAVIQGLKDKGLFGDIVSHNMSIPLCSRSKDVIEPLPKDQWYLNCQDMAAEAVQRVKDGELEIIPEYFKKIWYDWLDDCVDWCLSRQLWWGHRIPAYLVKVKGHEEGIWISARNENEAEIKASKKLGLPVDQIHLKQDNDVLDTWFSSGLFPYTPLGWPNKTQDYKNYYPTSLLETGHDIVFFWVARMVMLGLKLTGELPFKKILLHGTLRDAYGRKMSKSLGNVIDPMDVIQGATLQDLQRQVEMSNLDPVEIEKAKEGQKRDFPFGIAECGTDALRFTLCCSDVKCEEINMDISLVENNRRFCNKIWQGYKFVLMKLGNNFTPVDSFKSVEVTDSIDQWILSRLDHMVRMCNQCFESYSFHMITEALYNFWIMDFCDVYLECVKPVFVNDNPRRETVQQTLHYCVEVFLRASSPFMPFLTEELYQRLPRGDNQSWPESICISQYPQDEEFADKKLEELVKMVKNISSAVLQISQQYQLKARVLPVILRIDDKEICESLHEDSLYQAMMTLSRAKTIEFNTEVISRKNCVSTIVHPNIEVTTVLEGIIDPQIESSRLEKKLAKMQKDLVHYSKKLQSMQRKSSNSEKQQQLKHKIESLEAEMKTTIDKIETIRSMSYPIGM